ncbi:MAG: cytochrome c oxidase subunit I [Planctomycetes bacterium]|nr:cytochrome c oxidase subunit I [Planctomycetota bacterium]
MTTTTPDVHYLNHEKGFKSWFWTLDHKRLGVMYMWSVIAAFILGGIFALLVRMELMEPNGYVLENAALYGFSDKLSAADLYNHFFTLHGAIMVFLVIIPGIPAALGNFALPMMLGAKDVAYPKLNRFSYHLWLTGAIFFVMALVTKGLDTGWTFYAPYSTSHSDSAVIWATMGAFILGFSSIFTGLNMLVTIHKMRPDGMTWFKMPLFIWAIYATAVIQILATPVIGIALLMLTVERTLGVGIFDPALGGDPVLFEHIFWFYSHPAVYVMILPAMGVVSELIANFSRKPIFGYRSIAFSSVAIAIFSFIVWGHHMFVSGQSDIVNVVFSALTFSVAVPSAIKVFNWVATLYKGSISLDTPMWYALSVIWLFGIGGLTGLWLGTLGTDIHLHDTYFVVAHFHFVMVGSAIFSFIGGIFYWWPKMFGVMYSEGISKLGCAIAFIGFNMTFLPQFVAGSHGMPRRYFDYDPQFEVYNYWSSIGAMVLGVGLSIALYALVRSLMGERKPAPANPWGAVTLDWQCTSPPPPHNFDHAPPVDGPYDHELVRWNDELNGYEPVDPVDGDPNLARMGSAKTV